MVEPAAHNGLYRGSSPRRCSSYERRSAMTMAAHPALVLDADFRPMSYFPLALLRWEDAVHAVFNDRVSIVAEYDTWVRSPSTKIRLPSVVVLRKYRPAARRVQRVPARPVHVPILRRDVCVLALTFEHAIPRSRGGQTSWSSIVTACMPCNTGKGNSMRIKPRRPPREPTPSEFLAAKRTFPPDHLHESWMDYLYWDVELEA